MIIKEIVLVGHILRNMKVGHIHMDIATVMLVNAARIIKRKEMIRFQSIKTISCMADVVPKPLIIRIVSL